MQTDPVDSDIERQTQKTNLTGQKLIEEIRLPSNYSLL